MSLSLNVTHEEPPGFIWSWPAPQKSPVARDSFRNWENDEFALCIYGHKSSVIPTYLSSCLFFFIPEPL